MQLPEPESTEYLKKKALRSIEAQHQVATMQITSSEDEQLRLEQLLESSKPKAPEHCEGMDYLVSTAFRYPPLPYGSRFGTRSRRGILYLSETIEAVYRESAFYALAFWDGMTTPASLSDLQQTRNVMAIPVRATHWLDVSKLNRPERNAICSPVSWGASQAFGDKARDASIELIRYPSARMPAVLSEHSNLAVLAPSAVGDSDKPLIVTTLVIRADEESVRMLDGGRTQVSIPKMDLRKRPF